MIDSIQPATTQPPPKARAAKRVWSSAAVQYAALAAVTLLALGLRLFRLGEWSFWIDEVLTVNYVLDGYRPLSEPTSFGLIALAFELYGVSDWSARLVPALIGVVTLPLIYFPTRRLFGPAAALLAVFLLALSPWHLYWSQNARFYTALLLFYTLGVFAFYRWLETDRLPYLGAAGLLFGLAVLERFTAVFFAPAAALYLLALLRLPAFGRPPGLNRRNLLLLAVPALLFAAYMLFFTSIFRDLSFWIFGRSHNPLRVLLSVIYDLGLPLFVLALLGGAFLIGQRSRPGLYFFLNALVPLLALLALSPFTQTFSRYVYMTLPFWVVLAAYAAKELVGRAPPQVRVLALGLALVLAADAFSQNVLYYTVQQGSRENYKAAFAQVSAEMQPGDWVVSTRHEIGEYYLGLETIDSNRIDLDGILASGRPAWFVMDNRTYVSEELGGWLSAETDLVGVHDVHIPGRPMEMRVYYYPGGALPP